MWHALSNVDLANSQKHVVITYIASNLLDTGLAIYYCKFINSSEGARAKYRFVRAFLLLNSVFNRCGTLVFFSSALYLQGFLIFISRL